MKRKKNQTGSLDLLLDTICNAFGGILLIALLVIILLNTTSKSKSLGATATETSKSELLKNELEREKLTRELVELKDAVKEIKEHFGDLVDGEILALAGQVKEMEKVTTGKIIQKSQVEGRINQVQQTINELKQQLKDLQEELENSRDKKKELDQKIAKSFKKNSGRNSVPKMQQSQNRFTSFFLIDGRVIGPSIYRNGKRNEADFSYVSRANGSKEIRPKKGKGITIPDRRGDRSDIEKLFKQVSPSSYSLRLWIWEDTFGRYDPVLSAINDQGFTTQIYFMTEGEYPVLGPNKNTKVQGK